MRVSAFEFRCSSPISAPGTSASAVIEPRHVSLRSTPSIFLVSSFIYLFGRRVLAGLLIVIKRRGVTRTGGVVGRFGIFDGQPRGLMTVVMEYRK